MVNRIFDIIEILSVFLKENFVRHLEKRKPYFVIASAVFRCEVLPHLQFPMWVSY